MQKHGATNAEWRRMEILEADGNTGMVDGKLITQVCSNKYKLDLAYPSKPFARVRQIKFIFVCKVFGRILVRDVFHWIQIADTSN